MPATWIRIPLGERKALSAFNLGSTGFMLAPEMSATILSCLEEPSDIAGLMANVPISAGSIKFLVDNEVWDQAAWACESQCFANSPAQQVGEGLGETEIPAHSLRYVLCMTRELLEDASVNIESWLLGKADRAFRNHISTAIVSVTALASRWDF